MREPEDYGFKSLKLITGVYYDGKKFYKIYQQGTDSSGRVKAEDLLGCTLKNSESIAVRLLELLLLESKLEQLIKEENQGERFARILKRSC